MFSTTIYSATGDIQHAAAVKAYKSRCQNGDYINAKFEELKDIEQINIIGNKYKKAPFLSSCYNLQIKPNVDKTSPPSSAQPETNIPVGDTYEAVDMRYRAELGIYSKKCSRGDYAIYKDEQLRDVNRINELANQLGKPKFDSSSLRDCDTNPSFYTGGGYDPKAPKAGGYEQNKKMFTGGEYVPDNSKISISKVIPKKESYEERDKRIIQESEQYQRTEQYQRSLQPQTIQPIQDGAKLTMLEVINGCSEDRTYKIFNEIANCVRESYNSRGTSPSHSSVKAFYVFLDEIVEESNKGTYGFAKAKGEMLRAWQTTIDASNNQQLQNLRQQQNNIAITASPAIGNNCELAKAQAYLTPVPSGSFTESQRYADSAYASCMANMPIPAPPVAPTPVLPKEFTCTKSFDGRNINCK